MNRRQFLLASALGAAPSSLLSQPKAARVGILLARHPSFYAPGVVARLTEVGYREGANLTLLQRSADGDAERFPSLARELVDANCDLIFAIGPEHPVRALQTVAARAIVFLAADYDPIERGIVTNLRRPDRNTTGVYIPQGLLAAKRLEIMREILPTAKRFLVFSDIYSRDQLPQVRKAAEAASVELTVIDFPKLPYDFKVAFESARRAQAEAFIALTSPVFGTRAGELRDLLKEYRIPGAGWAAVPQIMNSGFIFGYGEEPTRTGRKVADVGVRVLKGAKPSEIPVEQVDEFELFVNAKAARDFGVKIPETVKARTTRIQQ